MKKNNKKKKWMRPRHRLARNLLNLVLRPYSYAKYGIRVERFREQGKRPYLVLFNHQTAFDQFFVGMAFRGPVYYVASEDIFSKGWVSSVIRYLVAPIPIKKQTTDLRAILNCIRVAKEGGTIALAPEGNRTYSGKTEYMSDAIAPLARKLGLPIALYRIEGGYGVHPRWSDVVRKGKMRGYVARVVEPEEYAAMTDAELFEVIRQTIYVNEANTEHVYRHKRLAEDLERAMYVGPDCGLSTFESNRDIISCKRCKKQIRYTDRTELVGVDCTFPYRFASDWYDAQADFVNALDLDAYKEAPMYIETVEFSRVIPYVKKESICKSAEVSLWGDRITVKTDDALLEFPFDSLFGVTVLGKNKLNLYHGDTIYQIKGSPRFNALKYVHIYHRYKNICKGDQHAKFLGL